VNVQVRLFAVARQLTGRDRVELELPEGATIARLREELGRALPRLQSVLPQFTFAIAAEYAGEQAVIPAGAEVACIPPVSGG